MVALLRTSAEVVLFWVTLVAPPMVPLIKVVPAPVPALVIVPVLLTDPEIAMPPLMALLLSRASAPVPAMGPETYNIPAVPLTSEFVSVVVTLLTVKLPLMARGEAVLLSVMAVTFEPISAVIAVVPVPRPEFVMVPTLFTVPETRMLLALEPTPASKIRLPVPETTPPRVMTSLAELLRKVSVLEPFKVMLPE